MVSLRLVCLVLIALGLAGCREDNPTDGGGGGGGGGEEPVILWKDISDGLPINQPITALTITPVATFASTPTTLLRLGESGVTWRPTAFPGGQVEDILYDAGRGTVLARTATELYRSPNGAAWERLGIPEPFEGLALGDDGALIGLAPGGRYVSFGEGISWTRSDLSGLAFETDLDVFERVTVGTDRLYLAAPEEGGLYYSSDAETWVRAPALGSRTIRDVAADANGILYAVPASGPIYRSTQGATAWAAVGGDDLGDFDGLRNALVVNADDALYLATSGDAIVFSQDRGDTWMSYRGQAFDRGDPLGDRVLALALTAGDFLYATTSDGMAFVTNKSTSALK